MSDERHRYQEPEDGKLPEPDQDRSLESAITEFGGCLSPDGTGDGDEDPPDYADCFRSLEDKARELGVLYDRWVDELGFRKLRHNYGIGYEDSYGFIRDDIAVFDLRPANVIHDEAGLIVPIDSIPVRLSDDTRRMFE